jgi:hypothetical protein
VCTCETREMKKHWVTTRRLGLALFASGLVLAACSGHASAATWVSGPVTLQPTSQVAAGTPLQSGQTIDIIVAPNSTLDRSQLEAAGFTSGAVSMKAEECVDPGGVVVNLPKKPAGKCDSVTIAATQYPNADGSFEIKGFTVLALPDKPIFNEPPNSMPACGSGTDYCVIYLGPDQNDFSKPHLFSVPFLVTANSTDSGQAAAPALGGSSGVSAGTTSQSQLNASVSLSGTDNPGGSGFASGQRAIQGSLAFTGPPQLLPSILVSGFLLFLCGAVGHRRFAAREGVGR